MLRLEAFKHFEALAGAPGVAGLSTRVKRPDILLDMPMLLKTFVAAALVASAMAQCTEHSECNAGLCKVQDQLRAFGTLCFVAPS